MNDSTDFFEMNWNPMDGLSQDSELNPRRRQPVGHGVQFVSLNKIFQDLTFELLCFIILYLFYYITKLPSFI